MVVLLLLTVTLLGPPGGAEPASAAASATATAATREAAPAELTARAMTRNQRQVLDLINRARRSRGRGSLLTNGLQNRNAQNWAEHLRSIQALIHRRPPFGASVGWCAAAENIRRSGNGGTILATHRAFMRSAGHKANILNSRWTRVGVGVARDRYGEYFIVHSFADYSC